MPSYLSKTANRTTPQSEPLLGQVKNNAGGHAWSASLHTQLVRFLILGTQGGSHYQSEASLTRQNVKVVDEALNADFAQTLAEIVDVSVKGRAGKQDPTLFALAVACSFGIGEKMSRSEENEKKRTLAMAQIPAVCRTGTMLFTFLNFVKEMRGFGMGLRKAVAAWYEDESNKNNDQLAYQLVKYRQREGWTHRDVLRKMHPEVFGARNEILNWVTTGEIPDNLLKQKALPQIIHGFDKVQKAESAISAAQLARDFKLPREAVPTDFLNDPEIWHALLPQMPIGALVRNLATMTRNGTINPHTSHKSDEAMQTILQKLSDPEAVRKSRIHPIQVLAASMTYGAGRSARGSSTWDPATKIMEALNDLFYLSFGNVEPTGKSHLIALDVSGSMHGHTLMDIPGLTPRVASAAMALVSMKTGDPYEVVAFTGGSRGYWGGRSGTQDISGLTVLNLSPRQMLGDVIKSVSGLPFGGTDCALPILWAEKKKKAFDLITVWTDNETWAGNIHPDEALKRYRRNSGLDTRFAVIGMVANNFTIANPQDPRQIDLAGFDTSTPNILSEFAKGNL